MTESRKKLEPDELVEKNSTKKAKENKKSAVEIKAEAKERKEKEKERETSKPNSMNRGPLILGAGLLILGVLLLIGRLLRIPLGGFLWPFIFIIPGVLLFVYALSAEDRHGEGLSILGSILTILGMVFLAQSITGLWASWAYAWALVAPTSVGIAQLIYGGSRERPGIVESGRRLAKLGLIIFAVGFVFFELIVGVSGFGIASLGLPVFPVILIFAGALVLVLSILRR